MITPGSFGFYEGGVGDQRFSQRNRGDREAAPEVQHQFCGQQGNGPAGVFAESTEHYTDPAAGLDDICVKPACWQVWIKYACRAEELS